MGASVWASGSQVWNGNMGTLMAKPMNRPPKMRIWVSRAMEPPLAASSGMSKVFPPLKYRARKARIMRAEPKRVKRKNLMAAYCRFGPPHTPIMKYIGSSTSSKKTKKRMRSWPTKVPFIPVSRTSMRARNALGLWGSGKWSQE